MIFGHGRCPPLEAADLVDLQWLHHVEALAGALRQAGGKPLDETVSGFWKWGGRVTKSCVLFLYIL